MPTSSEKSNDFSVSISIQIQGKNIGTLALRLIGLAATLAAAIIKYRLLMHQT